MSGSLCMYSVGLDVAEAGRAAWRVQTHREGLVVRPDRDLAVELQSTRKTAGSRGLGSCQPPTGQHDAGLGLACVTPPAPCLWTPHHALEEHARPRLVDRQRRLVGRGRLQPAQPPTRPAVVEHATMTPAKHAAARASSSFCLPAYFWTHPYSSLTIFLCVNQGSTPRAAQGVKQACPPPPFSSRQVPTNPSTSPLGPAPRQQRGASDTPADSTGAL